MNEVLKTIYARRAVRKFKDQLVERAMIEKIIDAGKMAPSALNLQPWQFYVLTNKEMIHHFSGKISKAVLQAVPRMGFRQIKAAITSYFHKPDLFSAIRADDKIFHGAPVVILLAAPKDNEWACLDIGMCAQNMMLAAKSLGLDSCPVGLAKYIADTDLYATLPIPAGDQVFMALVIGYGDESPAAKERKGGKRVYL